MENENKPKHTPGPWTMGGSLLASTNGEHIAIVLHNINYGEKKLPRDYDSRAPKSFPETEANARLIAAAPDLLAALKKLEARVDWFLSEDFGKALGINYNPLSDEFFELEQARAAIAKAEGKGE